MVPEEAPSFRIAHAIRDALPTRVHAEMLFEQTAELLGEAAWIETAGDRTRLKLFRRDPEIAHMVAPWPLLALDLQGRLDFVTTTEGDPIDIPTRPGKAPKLHGLGPGQLNLCAGGNSITLAYGADGRWSEVSNARDPEVFAGAEAALRRKTGSPVELLAAFAATLEPGARPFNGRLIAPVPFPQGLESLWVHGRRHLSRAFFENRIPEDSKVAVADALCGDSAAGGPTRAAALAAWRAEAERVRPWLPKEEAALTITDEQAAVVGARVMRTPEGDAPLPPRDPASVPAAVNGIVEKPDYRAKLGEWHRLASASGNANWHNFRREENGWFLCGSHLYSVRGASRIRELVRAADAALDLAPPAPPPWPDWAPPLRVAVRTYRHSGGGPPDDDTLVAGDSWLHDLQPWDLDGDEVRMQAVRVRWMEA